jgi:putative aldouronate transport system substrate-binding protein
MLVNNMKKVALLVVFIMVFTIIAACTRKDDGGQETQTTAKSTVSTQTQTSKAEKEHAQPENSWEIDTSPVTLRLFFDKLVATANFEKYWGQDPVSKKWIEDTGVNIEFSYPPNTDHSKLNVMIASGDLPDMVYTTDDLIQVRELAKYDKIWALNELADMYAPGFIERNIDEHVLVAKRVKWDSMNLYAAPFYHTRARSLDSPYITKNMMGVVVIDKIYEELGSPQIKTIDDYLDLLRRVKENYPDMIPVQSNRGSSKDADGNPRMVFKTLPMAGLAARYYKDGDTYRKYWEHPNFIELLKFYNTLYNEDLIDKTEFTDNNEQLLAKEFSGRVFSDMSQDADNIDWFNSELHKVKPDWNFIMIDPPAIRSDMTYANDSFGGGIGSPEMIVIPKSGKHPDRVIRWLDYLYNDETQRNIIFGLEGHGYVMEGDIPVLTPEAETAVNKGVEDTKMTYGMDAYWAFRIGDYASIKRFHSGSDLQKQYYEDYSFFSGAESYPPDSEEIKIAANIREFYEVEIMRIIIAPPDQVESLYNNMIATMMEMGLDTLNRHITNYFNEKEAIYKKYSS